MRRLQTRLHSSYDWKYTCPFLKFRDQKCNHGKKSQSRERAMSRIHQILVHMLGATQSTIPWSIQILWCRVADAKKEAEKSWSPQNHAINEFLCANNTKSDPLHMSFVCYPRYYEPIKSEKVDILKQHFAEIFTFRFHSSIFVYQSLCQDDY